jgi:hypothetical protein
MEFSPLVDAILPEPVFTPATPPAPMVTVWFVLIVWDEA